MRLFTEINWFVSYFGGLYSCYDFTQYQKDPGRPVCLPLLKAEKGRPVSVEDFIVSCAFKVDGSTDQRKWWTYIRGSINTFKSVSAALLQEVCCVLFLCCRCYRFLPLTFTPSFRSTSSTPHCSASKIVFGMWKTAASSHLITASNTKSCAVNTLINSFPAIPLVAYLTG